MKKIKRILASAAFLTLVACTSTLPARAEPPIGVSVSFQYFYDNLSPYGAWVSYPDYGYVWVPRATPGFRPYFTSGHWVYTDDGWMWVSFYDWGWAPFHYGSWAYDPFYGWMWVPGYNWAPSWVTWGYCSGYYGWAPIAPGVSFSVGYAPPIDYWVFVPPRYVTATGYNTYYVANRNRIVFDNNTTVDNVRGINVVNNTGTYNGQRYSAGPARADFEKVSNTKVNRVSVSDNTAPGKARMSGDNVSVYRPRVEASTKSTAKPATVTPLETMKRSQGEPINKRLADKNAPERTSPAKQAAPQQKTAAPQQKTAMPQQKNVREQQPNTQERSRQVIEQKRNEDVIKSRAAQPQAQPKQRVESPSPQMNERKNVSPERNAAPRQPRQHAPKQPAPQRMQPQPEPRAMPEQQMDRQPKERSYQPQEQPRENRGNNNPKRFSF